MQNKKGQMGGTAGVIVSLFLGLMVVGILQLVSVLTVSKVNANIDIPYTLSTVVNNTVNLTFLGGSDNSTRLSTLGFVQNSERVANATNASKALNRNVDYRITLTGTSGHPTTAANFSFITNGGNNYNITSVKVTYDVNSENSFHTTADELRTNTLESFELGGTAQIVLAASTIIAAVFGLIFFARGR